MERLIRFFVERHLLVHVIVAVVVVLGVLQSSNAPRESFPNVTLPMLMVNAVLPGASARDVETKLAIPIQDAVEELDGVKEFNSVVTDGSVRTQIDLYEEFDYARIREVERDLKVLLDGIRDFPAEMEDDPTISRMNPKRFPVVQVALAGPTDDVRQAAKTLERRLRKLDETSQVALVGLQDPEVRILVDPVRARENGVTLLDVVDAIRRRNVSTTGGLLESANDRRQVVLWSRFADPREVAETVIRFAPGGGSLTVGDVARIESAREDTGLIAHTNGQPGVSIVVRKQEDADVVRTVDTVRAEVEATVLPPGVSYALVHDTSYMTRNRLQLMVNNGVLGAVLVTIVLFIFLTPVAAGWTLAGIPIVFPGTLALFPVFGFSINIVTLTGLVVVLGMAVDDAVVVSERVVSRRQAGEERHLAAVRGAAEMSRPVLASALTTMLAFMPLWGIGGMHGRMIESMPSVVILALSLSVMESFIVLPAHLSMGTGSRGASKRAFMLRWERFYEGWLREALRRRRGITLGFVAVLLATLLFIAPNMAVVLVPDDDAEAGFIKVTLPPGTPIERTEAVVTAIERQLPELMGDDLTAVTARIGHQNTEAFDRNQGSAENEAVVTVLVRPSGRRHTAPEWLEILATELRVPEAAELLYQVESQGPPAGRPITVHVSSNDNEDRRRTALEIAEWIRGMDGPVNVEVDERPGTPQIELALDYDRLALRGLDPEQVGQTLQAAFHGIVASEHRDLDDTTEFRVILDPAARRSLDALLALPVRGRGGEMVLLRDVVTPIEVPAVARIYHRDGRRTATVHGEFSTTSRFTAISFAEKLEEDLFPRFAGIPGMEIFVGGEARETRKTTSAIGTAALLAFVGITLVITLMLGSFLEAAFVVAIIPFAIAAVILTFAIHGRPLSMFAMMGAIGLAGVVVNSSIVMVDAIHRRVREVDDAATKREALIEAVVGRLRPIVVTTLTTLGGVMPMAYGIGGHDVIVSPMSLAIGWGLALSTGVTLFLVPILYTLAADLRTLHLSDVLPRARERLAHAARLFARPPRTH